MPWKLDSFQDLPGDCLAGGFGPAHCWLWGIRLLLRFCCWWWCLSLDPVAPPPPLLLLVKELTSALNCASFASKLCNLCLFCSTWRSSCENSSSWSLSCSSSLRASITCKKEDYSEWLIVQHYYHLVLHNGFLLRLLPVEDLEDRLQLGRNILEEILDVLRSLVVHLHGRAPSHTCRTSCVSRSRNGERKSLSSGYQCLPWAAFEAKELATLSDKKLTGIELANQGLTGETVRPD